MSKSLSKALQLLSIFSERKPYWKLEEIVNHTNIPKTTVFRLLKTMEVEGLIQKASFYQNGYLIEGNIYQLGNRLLALGQIASNQYEVRNIAFPYMRKLQEQLGESIQLIIRDHDEAIYIEKVESDKPVRLYTKIGRKAPLYAGACPRILLSFLPDHEIHRILTANKERMANNTLYSNDDIWKVIRETRQRGYTYSDSELENGTASFGTPIFNRYGEITASLSVASFATVLSKDEYSKYVYPMWGVSAEISKQLGYNKPYQYLTQTKEG